MYARYIYIHNNIVSKTVYRAKSVKSNNQLRNYERLLDSYNFIRANLPKFHNNIVLKAPKNTLKLF